MVGKVSNSMFDLGRIDADLRSISDSATKGNPAKEDSKSGFADLLKEGIKDVNKAEIAGEKASMDLVSGKTSNIHETMLAVTKAELGFNMLVQLRNKALEAYQEVMRMQV